MPFGLLLLVGLAAWPFLEIAAFIAVGREIGILPTLLTIVATSATGALLLRVQGLSALNAIRRDLRAGGLPVNALGHAALIGIGGLMLLLPGFVSDVVGLLLFLPPVRSLILAALSRNASVVVVRSRQSRRVLDLEPEEWQRRGDDGPGPEGYRPALPEADRREPPRP
ncbi:FxsA family protein [Prosthecomicrobium sp. N25]|uniref:FxsA family protein n=1 Tax=Prosthecomicrobium sp. N25 TaxID=3129254 RepID=UPI003077033B